MRAIFAQIIVTIIAEILCEPETSEENRAYYLRDFLPDCPARNARSLTRSDWLTYIYLFKIVRLQCSATAVMQVEV